MRSSRTEQRAHVLGGPSCTDEATVGPARAQGVRHVRRRFTADRPVSGRVTRTDTLYNRIHQNWAHGASDLEGAWQYALHTIDWGYTEDEDEDEHDVGTVTPGHTGTPDVGFFVSVRFPPSDYPEVLRLVREHN